MAVPRGAVRHAMTLSTDHFRLATTRRHAKADEEPQPAPDVATPRKRSKPATSGKVYARAGGSVGAMLQRAGDWTHKALALSRSRPTEPTARAETSAMAIIRNRFGGPLAQIEQDLLRDNTLGWRMHQAGQQLSEQGGFSPMPLLIAKGWASSVQRLHNRTLTVGVILPGDAIAIEESERRPAPTAVWSLTTLETVEASPLLALAEQPQLYPGLARGMQSIRTAEVRRLLSQVARLSEPCSIRRVAHFLLETHGRLSRVGLTAQNEFEMPMSEEAVAETLALKSGDTRRVIRLLKREDQLRWKFNRLTIRNPTLLAHKTAYAEPIYADADTLNTHH